MQPDGASLEVSVVIPCLNEGLTIRDCVRRALDAMRDQHIDGEVVVSDNGSTDDSIAIATAAGARVVSCPIKGYGAALSWGFRHARGSYLLMGDGDQSYDFALLPRFLEAARQGSRFVVGSRLRGRIEPGAMPPLHRYVGTPVLTWILNQLFGTSISDCNSGMRLIERQTFFSLGVVSTGMEFASEMLVKAAVVGVRITEVPIDFYRDRRDRRPHLRPFRDGWRHLRLLLWHAPDHMMTVPGLCMLIVGLVLSISQLKGPLSLGFTNLDIHYMILGVTLSLVGTSATSLGLVIGATMPAGRVKHVPLLAPAHRWYSFDRAAAMAGLLFLIGCLFDGYVLSYWLYHDRGTLTALYTRLTLFGLLLIAMAVQIGFSALLLGATFTGPGRMRRRTDVAPEAAHSHPKT
jgi:glycosyltransferase involved in cell wall biosynthesis